MTIPVSPPQAVAPGDSIWDARSALLDRCYAALVLLSNEMRGGAVRSRLVRQLLDLKEVADGMRVDLARESDRRTRGK